MIRTRTILALAWFLDISPIIRKLYNPEDKTVKVRRSVFISGTIILALLLLTSTGILAIKGILNRSQAQRARIEQQRRAIPAGVLVTNVVSGSLAERAGLRVDDLIVRYGEMEILDGASYYVARQEYLTRQESMVNLVVWRDGKEVTLSARTGRLGFDSRDWSSVKDEIDLALQNDDLSKAQQLLDQAERAKTLTPAQILRARILLIPDQTTAENEQKRAQLLEQFLSSHPLNFVRTVSYNEFYKLKRYHAASVCFERELKDDPNDVSTWLNLGNSYNFLLRFDDADRAADHVIKNRLPVSDYGAGVLYQVKGGAALGRRDLPVAMNYYEKAFNASPSDNKMAMWLLATTLSGDLQRFYAVAGHCRNTLPDQYARLQHHVDALEAYALVKNNRREKAQQLISRWKGTEQSRQNIPEYWPRYPGGAEIVSNWKDLLGEQ